MVRTPSAVLVAVLLLTATAGAGVVSAGSAAESSAYAGTNVTFETNGDAVVDYAVGGRTMVQSISAQSASAAESGGVVSVDAGLSAVTSIDGSALSLAATTETQATVRAESGATLTAHDNENGILVVEAGGTSQYVTASLSGSASAEQAGERRVVVTTEDGTKGTFIVVGDGRVTVNENGNVTAKLGENGTLVFRSYPDGRSEGDRTQERLIAEGVAAAEVYVTRTGESGGDLATDVVTYGQDTTVEVKERSEGTLTFTATRTEHEGRIIITSVSEAAMESTDDVRVTVDGEAAARASSYAELKSAANGGDTSKFLLSQRSSAEASADVLVAVNHFSTREVTVTDGGNGTETTDGGTTDGTDATETDGDATDTDGTDGGASTETTGPGLGVTVALVALLVSGLFARVRP